MSVEHVLHIAHTALLPLFLLLPLPTDAGKGGNSGKGWGCWGNYGNSGNNNWNCNQQPQPQTNIQQDVAEIQRQAEHFRQQRAARERDEQMSHERGNMQEAILSSIQSFFGGRDTP